MTISAILTILSTSSPTHQKGYKHPHCKRTLFSETTEGRSEAPTDVKMKTAKIWINVVMGCSVLLTGTNSFSLQTPRQSASQQQELANNPENSLSFDRRNFLSVVGVSAASLLSKPTVSRADDASSTTTTTPSAEGGVTMYKTGSGLKYIELAQTKNADAATPRYGQLCIVNYKASLKLPNDSSPQKFDEAKDFILKHGNGKMIPGLDEGLHTMKVGSTRRLIIPPKLGFVDIGLGPLPEYPWNRSKLSKLLDQMVEQQGGNLVYDITLTKIFDDEADQGYYDDDSLSPEEFAALQQNLRVKNFESSQQQS